VVAAPIYQVNPLMGSNLIITVFAVIVIGGMGSIMGAVISGIALGLIEALTNIFLPEAASFVIFVVMAVVILIKPAGLFGKAAQAQMATVAEAAGNRPKLSRATVTAMVAVLGVAA